MQQGPGTLRRGQCVVGTQACGLHGIRPGASTCCLVSGDEAAVFGNVGRDDRGEAAGGGHCSGTPALRRPSTTRSRPATTIGLSLGALARNRAMVKVGLIACAALT